MGGFKAEFYNSHASMLRTGDGTGCNAPEDGTGTWVDAGYQPTARAEAEKLYLTWSASESPACYKMCRIVEVGDRGEVIRVLRMTNSEGILAVV